MVRSPERGTAKTDDTILWALKDVSFEISSGDLVGIIGRNGAGKSTLLKILSRITSPTQGCVELDGRVGSLLEVGTGFHPELTGRENVFLNGAILGMKRAEVARKFEEIVAFAGVERFIDTPVKHYSSGMYLRLAFAVAAHMETEILLVDEVLAVGDAAFQLKCLSKMSEVSDSGRTILFVSHNMEAVARLCKRGILLEAGQVSFDGGMRACIDRYQAIVSDSKHVEGEPISLQAHPGRTKDIRGPVRLSRLVILDKDNTPTWMIKAGESLAVVLDYQLVLTDRPQTAIFGVSFTNMLGYRIASCWSQESHPEPISVEGAGRVLCRIPKVPLVPGIYRITVGCNTEAGHSDGVYDAATIEVLDNDAFSSRLSARGQGDVLFENKWEVCDLP
jgi:lipopolysaccharide transport system ATP-binding protein